MLRQTFCHVPGIGLQTERSLWDQGCHDWDCLLNKPESYKFGAASPRLTLDAIHESDRALSQGIHQYFQRTLGQAHAWRAWPEFRRNCVFLDIETDGGQWGDSVTVIGLFDGEKYRSLVKGEDIENFRDIISHYSLIVTFFGAGFDLPMLKKRFVGLELDHIHIDLCHLLRRLGYRGGLKRIERQVGIMRNEDVCGLTGRDAVFLWRDYLRGRDAALERLIAYNREDVVSLERLAEIAYRGLRKQCTRAFA